MLDLVEKRDEFNAKILVAGVGGAGNNAINRMVEDGITGIDLVGLNTDAMDLRECKGEQLQIGEIYTHGLGAGAKPEVGQKAAEESYETIRNRLYGTDMVIVTCGMGGGTGTGASPVVARAAKEQEILTVGVVTKPFKFEGKVRMRNAIQGIKLLQEYVDTLIVIPNDRLFPLIDRSISMPDALKRADEVLRQTVQSISDLINTTSDINLDFADLRTIMAGKGMAHIGIGTGSGSDKALIAVKSAVNSPLLETTIDGAKNIMLSIAGDISIHDAADAAGYVNGITGMDVNVIFGAKYDKSMEDTCRITLIATGENSRDNKLFHGQMV